MNSEVATVCETHQCCMTYECHRITMAKGFRGKCGNVTMYLIVGLVMSTKQVCWALAKILFAGEWGCMMAPLFENLLGKRLQFIHI